MSSAIVTTTVHVPHLLREYASNAVAYGHADTLLVVIGDRKTPPEAGDFCEGIARESGLTVRFLDVPTQLEYLAHRPALRDHLPFDSIQRRNVGMLLAYEEGAETIITIDDDNLLQNGDFVGDHSRAGSHAEIPARSSSTGWYNVCQTLIEERGLPFYPRGYPLAQRWPVEERTAERPLEGRIAVNAGLWLEDPDIDALTRLTLPVRAVGYRGPERFALEPGTWSPFCSQNTALARDVVPAYFLSPLVGRYDDIWASYVVARIAEHLGDLIAFGAPLVRQERNPHDLWRDLDQERDGLRLTDGLCSWLREAPLSAASYAECLPQIESHLRQCLRDSGEPPGKHDREFMEGFLTGLRIWSGLFLG